MGVFSGQAYLVGPAVVFVVIGVLALVLRWAYGSSARPAPPPTAGDDFGLLREVATLDDFGQANALRAVLSDAGIRSTSTRTRHGKTMVMVFAADLENARRVVGPRWRP